MRAKYYSDALTIAYYRYYELNHITGLDFYTYIEAERFDPGSYRLGWKANANKVNALLSPHYQTLHKVRQIRRRK